MASAPVVYDRLSELKAFDDTKAGVKGLVDSGITAIPRIFHHPPDPYTPPDHHAGSVIPTIDFTGAASRAELVAEVKEAAETVGFFQVINHGVPATVMSEMLDALRAFHEEPAEAKRPYYTRDMRCRVRYHSNFDLFQSPAATWRDTFYLDMAPIAPAPEEIPPACREVVFEYTNHVQMLGGSLLELMSEALGLHRRYLSNDAGCQDGISVVGHYYQPCPEPDLTLGTTRHSDPSFLTVLLQDGVVGGLQVLIGGRWVPVPPVAGAFVVNVGDFLQLMSNDRFKSVEHRPGRACWCRRAAAGIGGLLLQAAWRGGLDQGVWADRYGRGDRPSVASAVQELTAEEFINHYMDKGLVGIDGQRAEPGTTRHGHA